MGGVNFTHDEETRLIIENLDEFIEQEVRPIQEEVGETFTHPRRGFTSDGRFTPEILDAISKIRKRSADAGFYAMNLPEDVDGGAVSNVTWYAAKKHVAASGEPMAEFVLAGPEGPKPLLLHAEDEQVSKYLEPTVRGEKSTAFAQTEPGAGSDSPNIQTTAKRDGNEWVLNGTKQWITNAPYADFIQVFARTTPQDESGRYGGITCFIVERDEYEVTRMNNAIGREGLQAEILLDDVRLGDERVLGTVDNGFYQAMEFLSLGRLELGAEAIGRAEYLLEAGATYAREREAFGRPIGKFQQISTKLARGRARLYAADAAGLKCAWKLDQDETVIEDASIVKWLGTNVFYDVADNVVQIHGANGLAEENEFMDELHMARLLRIVEGTDEIQLNTIAKQFVGL